ncbi:hypothetical protein [Streptomyces lichenis]|uniref:PLL-like beta propeller domain-containing protein n=1 Tax=Streptomyces lichenis TaxID=2306967 RepID=A0ABT0IFN3_9ACTN|nr:hypothetical protein [Streptomyces lichenis]MCK8680125.1 hypothetical protein [Streptomyces lichenis]
MTRPAHPLRRSATPLLAAATLTAALAVAGLPAPAAASAASAATIAASASNPNPRDWPGMRDGGAIDPKSLVLPRWMSQISGVIGNRPLNRIVMPGSHDAGSWSITDRTGVCDTASEADLARKFPPVAAAISITQMSTIKQQLANGSRYLDLRLCKQGGKWYTYHGGPLGGLFFDDPATGRKGEINEIAEWLRDHPEEIVTIELRTSVSADSDPSEARNTAAEDEAEAVDLLGAAIGTDRIADRSKLSPTSTYNQFMAAKANVVLIDTKNRTGHPWAWRSDTVESRDSYVENKDWGGLIRDALKGRTAIDKISDTAIKRNEEVLLNDFGDSNKLFTLSGNVDSTLALPDAVADVAATMDYKPDGMPYMLYLAREHNTRLLAKLEGRWRHSDIARNGNIVQIDYVGMGGRRADGSIIFSDDMSAAIIANNTPTTAPNTLVGAERRADGGWNATAELPGAYSSAEFGGGERAVTAMPDGSLHFAAYGADNLMYHNIRFADGSWQGWQRFNSADADRRFRTGPLAVASTPDGTLHIAAVDKDGNLMHTLRRPDGSWQEGWGAVPDGQGRPFQAKGVALAGLPNNSIKVLAYGKDGAMRMTERYANGLWEQTGWQTIPGVGAPVFAGRELAVATTKDHSVQIAAIGQDGKVYHMVQDVRRVNKPWGSVQWSADEAMQATDVSLATLPDGSAQLVAIGLDGNVWHTVRHGDGSWTGFGSVRGSYGRALAATGVGITALPDGRTYTLAGAR